MVECVFICLYLNVSLLVFLVFSTNTKGVFLFFCLKTSFKCDFDLIIICFGSLGA